MGHIFLSHSTDDDAIARDLQQALGDHGLHIWIDSREMRGGDLLSPEIQHAIEDADAFIVLVSARSFQSDWVGEELDHAIQVQKQRRDAQPADDYRVVPLLLDDTKLGVLKKYFGQAPLYVPIRSAAGGVEAALDAILVALGKRAPADVAPTPQPHAEPLEELVLELTDLKLEHVAVGRRDAGATVPLAPGTQPMRDVQESAPAAVDDHRPSVLRATARARLRYEPATPGQRSVESTQSWRFVAPLGPLEADDLRWYLEKYHIWPGGPFRDRAAKVEKNLPAWGRQLHDAAMPAGPTDGVRHAWAKVNGHAGRRFSVQVDSRLDMGAPEADMAAAREAATLLLGLPWELMYDGESFLFQGAKPTRVRRRLPNTRDLDVPVLATPIRVLLICARPEDAACGYIDHRSSAQPLVDAMEQLPGLVDLHILTPPTLPALREELDRARRQREPYHVVHFDGHGVYDRRAGLGGLCFEHPDDVAKLEGRRHETIFIDALGPLLKEHRIPLVYLDACQTAQADQASESVATKLLEQGVASVVAMSHSVLVKTAERFATAFYAKLAEGGRVGDAMLEGQRQLKDDTRRGEIFGAGELRLEDWFVPVLFQEQDDPQLFQQTPATQTVRDFHEALEKRLGKLPPEPSTGFIGRSRELLALERLLDRERYAVLRGQGGEGKTALAAEFARWMVRSQRFQRAAFVSVEEHSTALAVLDALGQQLVPNYTVATFDSLERAEQPVVRALREQSTVVVVDNLESILQLPHLASDSPDALAEDNRRELEAILALCERLGKHGDTRLVFTSREVLPAPFDAAINRHELQRLHRIDAVQLVQRVVSEGAATASLADAELAAIEDLVETVHGHARTLALLEPSLRGVGVTATRKALVELMADMDRQFPGQRERSLFASVDLSLRRLSPETRQRVRVLGVFHGGVDVNLLRVMMQWENEAAAVLVRELAGVGLATATSYAHFSLDPALCPYLRNLLDDTERAELTARWVEAMRGYVAFLNQEEHRDAQRARTLTLLELPNLRALLAQVVRGSDPEATVELAGRLRDLVKGLGRPRLLAWVADVRDTAAARIGDAWNHLRFETARSRVEEELENGRSREALARAQKLLEHAQTAGEDAYPGAAYDLAWACWLLGRALKYAGGAQHALSYLDDGRRRFEALDKAQGDRGAAGMASACVTERGDCLRYLGRLDEAATVYEESIRLDEHRGARRDVAVGKAQLGSVRLLQRRHQDALTAYTEARDLFTRLREPGSVATAWHQMGMAYRYAGQPDRAEDAYRQSLAIEVQLGNVHAQATTLNQLGNLYQAQGRLEEAASQYRRCTSYFVALGDVRLEGVTRSNLGDILRRLDCWDEARQEILRAIECDEAFGHVAEPWKTWGILADIEVAAGNAGPAAQAKAHARAAYVAYRRDGGENHDVDGRIASAVTAGLLAGHTAGVLAVLDRELASSSLADWLRPFVIALRTVAAGNRDRSLADIAGLHYRSAAELLIVIDRLEAAATGAA
ncbi:MAG TPA: tetratricopeptide repeat protein [Kofleriaceae bacterium]